MKRGLNIKDKKKRKYYYPDEDLYRLIRSYAVAIGLPVTRTTEKIVSDFFYKHKKVESDFTITENKEPDNIEKIVQKYLEGLLI